MGPGHNRRRQGVSNVHSRDVDQLPVRASRQRERARAIVRESIESRGADHGGVVRAHRQRRQVRHDTEFVREGAHEDAKMRVRGDATGECDTPHVITFQRAT